MQPTTDAFDRTLRYSHVVAATCELIFPSGDAPVSVPVQAGQVTIDRTAQNRRVGSVTIPWSLQADADLDVDLRTLSLGGYVDLRRGVRYADGSTELVQLGYLRVESVSWDTLEASASLEVADRMSQIRDEPFLVPFAAGGMRPAQAAVSIVYAVFGDAIDYLTPYDPAAILGDVFYADTRTDALSEIEQGYSAETYFNAAGDFVFAAKPGEAEPIVADVDAGELGVLVDARENLDRTGIYNGVLVKGQAEADQPPVSGLAVFDDPSSPVRWGGPFGKVALIADASSVVSAAQAQETAAALLRLRLKQTRSLELRSAPNPALEAGDTIRVSFPDGREEQHLIDATTIDLAGDVQTIVTRSSFAPGAMALRADEMTHDPLLAGRQAWRS